MLSSKLHCYTRQQTHGRLPMKPKMSLMVGTKMTRALVPASRTMVMMVWRIQLNSLEAHRSWLTEVRICAERERDRRRRSNGWTLATAAMSDGRQPPHDTYREQHHGDGEGDGGQHSQTDDQQDDIGLVDLGVGVQQLGLHMDCVTKKKKKKKRRLFRPDAQPAPTQRVTYLKRITSGSSAVYKDVFTFPSASVVF